MGLRRYMAKRALDSLVTAFFVFVLCFFLCYVRLREARGISETQQFISYVRFVFLEQFGQSGLAGSSNSLDYVIQQLPYTIFLMLSAGGFSILIGTLVGSLTSYKNSRKLDTLLTSTAIVLTIIPTWFLSLLLMENLRPWFPTGKWHDYQWAIMPFWEDPIGKLQNFLWHAFLPTLSLTLGLIGIYFIVAKGCVRSILNEPYIITAKAKGVSKTKLILKHALRNAIIPIAAGSALAPIFLLNSVITIERIFSLNGAGATLYSSVVTVGLWGEDARQYPLPTLPAIFLLFSFSIIIIQYILDIANYGLDPRLSRSMTDGAGLSRSSIYSQRISSKARRIKRLAKRFIKGFSGKAGSAILLFFVFLIVLAPILPMADPELQQPTARNQPPSAEHFFGTDELGRDVLSRSIWAAKHSLLESLGALLIAVLIGAFVGMVSGYMRDRPIAYLLDRLTDVFLSVPLILVAFFFPMEPSSLKWVLAVGLSTWAIVAKVVRAQTLVTREKAYIEAAKALGASKTRILIYHVFPDTIGVIAANIIYVTGLVIMIQTSLDFFGFKRYLFSTDPNVIPVKVAPVLTWGSMLSYSASGIINLGIWWTAIPPITCIALFGISLVLIGNKIADIFSPQTEIPVRL